MISSKMEEFKANKDKLVASAMEEFEAKKAKFVAKMETDTFEQAVQKRIEQLKENKMGAEFGLDFVTVYEEAKQREIKQFKVELTKKMGTDTFEEAAKKWREQIKRKQAEHTGTERDMGEVRNQAVEGIAKKLRKIITILKISNL